MHSILILLNDLGPCTMMEEQIGEMQNDRALRSYQCVHNYQSLSQLFKLRIKSACALNENFKVNTGADSYHMHTY